MGRFSVLPERHGQIAQGSFPRIGFLLTRQMCGGLLGGAWQPPHDALRRRSTWPRVDYGEAWCRLLAEPTRGTSVM
ncbi:hypothetical protein A8144_03000 [Mycobacterium leprae 3125609]|nr:hypothetical protein A8144_03000 [Mycobacterium leprae 3125609]OAX71160.1 hypothetical protein A3216_07385 [Mycobacterium leprae 7935681]